MERMRLALGLWVLSAVLGSCSESTPRGDFETYLPGTTGRDASEDGGGSGNGGDGEAPSDDPLRALEEADIIQLDGDRLYALSRYGGLSMIDATDPAALRTLGRFARAGVPFEMYRRGAVLLVLYSDYGHWEARETDDGTVWDWGSSSQVVALDVSNPAAIVERGSFSIPGAVSDSRIVGDVLYLVAHEDGSCWGCEQNKPRTTVGSFDISNPAALKQVDQLSFEDVNDVWGYGPRSITVTTERMYVAGREYDGESDLNASTIQVVDISNPMGDMVLGTTIEAAGEITSRFQMDEYEGVLRVVSQPGTFRPNFPPTLQTFEVVSSAEITPLARLELAIPPGESLRAVRFDGPRGYAITFLQTDPLFTLDLSDPAAPAQVGELVIPGFVYHMEPRGERVVGLGYDQGNPDGSLHVSIFDVSDLAAPKQLARVNFGGDWAQLPEDQDRIQKAIRLLEELELVLVPFSGWESSNSPVECYGTQKNAVQLIDWKNDTLTLRGAADTRGQPRRALIHRAHMLTVSDDAVEAFDIQDRDVPTTKSRRLLARYVSETTLVGDSLARVGQNWWTRGADIDFVPQSDPSRLEPLSQIQLADAVGFDATCQEGLYVAGTYAHGSMLYVLYDAYGYGPEEKREIRDGLAVFDVADPSAPTLVKNHGSLRGEGVDDGYDYGAFELPWVGARVAQVGSALVFQRGRSEWRNDEQVSRESWLDVVDLSDPEVAMTTRVDLPAERGHVGLTTRGDQVFTTHYAQANQGRVFFYVDRIDIQDPRRPKLASSINVPGVLFAVTDAARVVTVSYAPLTRSVAKSSDCYDTFGYRARFTPDDPNDYAGSGTCAAERATLHSVRLGSERATLLDSLELEDGEWPSLPTLTDARLFFSVDTGYGYGIEVGVADECWGYCGYGGSHESTLAYLADPAGDELALFRQQVQGQGWYGAPGLLAAHRTTALFRTGYGGGMWLLKTKNPAAPAIENVLGPEWPTAVTIDGDTALCAGGYSGVWAVSLTE